MTGIVRSLFLKTILLQVILILTGCSEKPGEQADTMTDIDGNVYKTIKIGDMIWMAENLRVTRYRNGESIRLYSTAYEWSGDYNGLCTDYEFVEDSVRGRLYNWHAVKEYDNHILAPEGWHIPTESEWRKLIFYLGGENKAGSMMKDTLFWSPVWFPKSDVCGFNAPPAGFRDYTGVFQERETQSWYWSSTKGNSYDAKAVGIYRSSDNIELVSMLRSSGLSVRCVKD